MLKLAGKNIVLRGRIIGINILLNRGWTIFFTLYDIICLICEGRKCGIILTLILIKVENFSLDLQYETEDYISSMSIDKNLELFFSILYKQYKKEWSYELKCVSLKKE